MKRIGLSAGFGLVLAGALSVGVSAFAQQTQPAGPDAQTAPAPDAQAAPMPAHAANPHKQAMRLAKELNLTPDQTAKVEPILADRDQKIAALRANTAIGPMVAQAQMRAIQKSTREQLSGVLTPAQMQQMKALQQSRGGKGQAQPLVAPAA